MTNRELGYIIKEIQKNEAIKLAPLAKRVEINRSYLSTLINSEEEKEIDEVLVGKIARQFPAYFKKQKQTVQAEKIIESDISHLILTNLKELRGFAMSLAAATEAQHKVMLQSLERIEGKNPGELSALADTLTVMMIERLHIAQRGKHEHSSM